MQARNALNAIHAMNAMNAIHARSQRGLRRDIVVRQAVALGELLWTSSKALQMFQSKSLKSAQIAAIFSEAQRFSIIKSKIESVCGGKN